MLDAPSLELRPPKLSQEAERDTSVKDEDGLGEEEQAAHKVRVEEDHVDGYSRSFPFIALVSLSSQRTVSRRMSSRSTRTRDCLRWCITL